MNSVDPAEYNSICSKLPNELVTVVDFFEEYGELFGVDVNVLRSAILELEKNGFDLNKLKIEFAGSYLKTGVETLHDHQARLENR